MGGLNLICVCVCVEQNGVEKNPSENFRLPNYIKYFLQVIVIIGGY